MIIDYTVFDRRGHWSRRRSWWPRRSCVSGHWLCFRTCHRHRLVITGPGEPVVIDSWISEQEYLWFVLKGDIDGT